MARIFYSVDGFHRNTAFVEVVCIFNYIEDKGSDYDAAHALESILAGKHNFLLSVFMETVGCAPAFIEEPKESPCWSECDAITFEIFGGNHPLFSGSRGFVYPSNICDRLVLSCDERERGIRAIRMHQVPLILFRIDDYVVAHLRVPASGVIGRAELHRRMGQDESRGAYKDRKQIGE